MCFSTDENRRVKRPSRGIQVEDTRGDRSAQLERHVLTQLVTRWPLCHRVNFQGIQADAFRLQDTEMGGVDRQWGRVPQLVEKQQVRFLR